MSNSTPKNQARSLCQLLSRQLHALIHPYGGQLFGVALGVAILSQRVQAASTLPFYEPFPSAANPYNGWAYGGNENLGVAGATTSGNVWTFGNSASSTSGRITTGFGLSYPGLTNIDLGGASFGVVTRQNNTSTKDRAASLTIPNNPAAVYASCLVNIINQTNLLTTYPYPFFGLTTNTGGTSVSKNGATVFFDSTGHLLIGKNSGAPSSSTTYALTTNTTHLVVIRYKYNPGAPDQVDLWLDPTSLGNDATIPAPTLTTTNNSNLGPNYLSAVAYFASPQNLMWIFDEVRAATSWSGVTPTNDSPGNHFTISGGGSGCQGDSYAISLNGSDMGVDYLLYTNGVVSDQTISGTGAPVSFVNQTATALYTILATNTTTANVGWMNGSASVTVLVSPAITTQPASAIVATNGRCAFNVAASGSGLHYQWYRNGSSLADGGHVAGSQTDTLVISPSTTADEATVLNGYYVVITNTCGALARSVTNALTLNPPANLIWSGDGTGNLWDVNTSLEWNTQSAVFHFGDNVAFDDTSTYLTANLVDKNLSPGSVTINGAQTFTFVNAGGSLVGNGSLLMNGSGTLNLNAPNSMSGGLVISNGIVSFNSGGSVGTGPITLAGGTFSAINSSSLVVGNPIVVTADSTIRINNTTGSALTLANTLAGVSGTLTFRNNVSAKPTIQLTSTGFDFTQPVAFDIGSGTGLIVSGNNTAGTQTFSGVISGPGSIARNGGGGTTILSGDNTYNGGTWLLNGTLGVGIDSTSTAPPTVDSGALGTGTLVIDSGNASPRIFASGGAHSVDNLINYTNLNGGSPFIITGANDLTFNGSVDLGGGDHTIQVDNTGKTTFNGDIANGGFTKTGNGILYLNSQFNSYTDPTIISNGTLGGTGVLSSAVTIMPGATLAPGASVGTLTINSDLTVNGNLAIEVDKTLSQSNDIVMVSGILTNSGTGSLTVANLGSALVVGDTFTLFSQPLQNGSAMNVTGGGATWANHLGDDGSITVASLVSSQPPVITSTTISGGNIIISGNNGTAGSGYTVLSSTSLITARGSWTVETTGTFGAGGLFSVSLPVSTTTPAKFYLLKLQ